MVVVVAQSGKFRHQRSAVQIPSSAKFYWTLFTVSCIENKNKEKEDGNGPFLQFTVHTCSVKKFIDVSTRTGGLWGRKQPLCQLSHNHCLKSDYFSPPLCRFSIKMQTRTRTDIDQTEPRGWAHTLLSPKPWCSSNT